MDLATIAGLVSLSVVLTWLLSSYLDMRDEEKRESERRKALERLESSFRRSSTDEPE